MQEKEIAVIDTKLSLSKPIVLWTCAAKKATIYSTLSHIENLFRLQKTGNGHHCKLVMFSPTKLEVPKNFHPENI